MKPTLIVFHEGKEVEVHDVHSCQMMKDGWLSAYNEQGQRIGCFYQPTGYYFSIDIEFEVIPKWPQRRED